MVGQRFLVPFIMVRVHVWQHEIHLFEPVGGRLRDELLQFFTIYKEIDIFCLQEIYR